MEEPLETLFLPIPENNDYVINCKGKIMKVKTNSVLKITIQNGYPTVSLNKKHRRLHRLLAQVFIPNPDPTKTQVNHKNSDKLNYSLQNLEWISGRENVLHSHASGNRKKRRRPQYDYSVEGWTIAKVEAFPNMYEVSKDGRLRNTTTKRVLYPYKDDDGYVRVTLHRNNMVNTYLLHRIIAMTFLGLPKNENDQINHKNKNREDNSVDNLEWVTILENCIHKNNRKVQQIQDNRIIKEHDCPLNAAKSLKEEKKLDSKILSIVNNIRLCCLGYYRKYHTYEWKYVSEGIDVSVADTSLNGPNVENHCANCEIVIPKDHIHCIKCSPKRRRLEERPTKDHLLNLLENNSRLAVGKMYNISQNTIRRWTK